MTSPSPTPLVALLRSPYYARLLGSGPRSDDVQGFFSHKTNFCMTAKTMKMRQGSPHLAHSRVSRASITKINVEGKILDPCQ